MSLILRKSLAANAAQARIMEGQYAQVNQLRQGSIGTMNELVGLIGNAGQTPADAYREFDNTTTIELVKAGEHATLTRLLQKSKPISIGKLVFEHRKSTAMNKGQTSLTGQTGVKIDAVDYDYGGTVVPVHDKGFGRSWRESEAMRSDGFDALTDDAREAERAVIESMNKYLWEGDSKIVVKGRSWLGIKADPSIEFYTLQVDLSDAASTPEAMRAEVAKVRDILYIQNNCTKPLRLGVSREIASNWERVFSVSEGVFGTVGDMIGRLRGISEIYEDSELVGNEITLYWDDQQGFHPVTGMGLNTVAIPRNGPFDDFTFVKWCAVGFIAKMDASGHKCALYASGT